jgi:hypothetical protein
MKIARLRHFLIDKWWLVYLAAIAWNLLWLAFEKFGRALPSDDVVFYPWIAINRGIVVITLIAGFLLACILFALKRKSFLAAILLLTITVFCWIVFLAWIGPIVGYTTTSFEPDPGLSHVASTRADGHVYNLATHEAYANVLGQAYIFYECDSLGVSCYALYRYKPDSLDAVYADIDNPPYLSVDGNSVLVHIGGKVVYQA